MSISSVSPLIKYGLIKSTDFVGLCKKIHDIASVMYGPW